MLDDNLPIDGAHPKLDRLSVWAHERERVHAADSLRPWCASSMAKRTASERVSHATPVSVFIAASSSSRLPSSSGSIRMPTILRAVVLVRCQGITQVLSVKRT